MKRKFILVFILLFSIVLIACDEMSGPTGRIEEVNNPIKIVENDEKIIEVKFRDTYKQFRNNKKKLLTADLKGISFDDETFNNFKDTNMNIKEYEEWFLDNAEAKGINSEFLHDVFSKLNLMLDKDIIKHPIIIDTAIYKDKECFIIGYQWEYSDDINKEREVSALKNKMIIIVEQKTADVLSMLKLN